MQKLKEVFTNDGTLDLVQTNLKGVATDGASVMIGVHHGLKALLKNFTSNPLLSHIHCYAHRIELCINKAFNKIVLQNDFNMQKNLTTAINGLSDFYRSRAVKRKAELVDLCKRMKIKMYKLKRIFNVRWTASQVVAINSELRMYSCVWENLSMISDNDDNDNAQRKITADSYLKNIQNANFFMALSFFQDVFEVIQQYSLAYRQQAAVLAGQKLEHEKLKIKLRQLREDDGPVLKASLRRIKCTINYGKVQPSAIYLIGTCLLLTNNCLFFKVITA